jgi:cation diffusion facilitator family transporter
MLQQEKLHSGMHVHHKGEEHHHDHSGHNHDHEHHGHSHGLIDPSIVRSKEGVKAVSWSLLVLFITAFLQVGVFAYSNSVALFADLIHNFGDALTALPLGLAFFFRNETGEKWAGYFVVLVIFISALVAGYAAVTRFFDPVAPTNLWALAIAGLIGFLGNELAAIIRKRAGKRLHSPALIADGDHARVDGLVSLGVVASALFVALGFSIADPLIGLGITALIVHITWQSWRTVTER